MHRVGHPELLNIRFGGVISERIQVFKSTASSFLFSWRMSFGDIDVDVQEAELILYKVFVCVSHLGGG